jgi:hypothetical protein
MEEDCRGGQGLSLAVEPEREREGYNTPIPTKLISWTNFSLDSHHKIPLVSAEYQITVSSVSIETRLRAERPGLDSLKGTTTSRPVVGPTEPPIQWVPRVLCLGVKRPGHVADYSLPLSAEVKNAWSYTCTSPIRLHGVVFN